MTFYPFDLGPAWENALKEELQKPYLLQLAAFVAEERRGSIPIYPPEHLTFNALKKTAPEQVKVVVVGQDPYHGAGQAHGLSFSVAPGVRPPPSLQNIFKELHSDLNLPIPNHGCLTSWAEQGVLLLNATLTVRQGTPLSHFGRGWERFTDAVLAYLAQRENPIAFVLWGKNAQQKAAHIQALAAHPQHLILKAAHPSPFAAHSGFFGCRHFSQINAFLSQNGQKPINWDLMQVSAGV